MGKVILQVLGCGDAFASGSNHNTCFYLKAPKSGILIDCGVTTQVAMKKSGVKTDDIKFIIITHFHGDHFGGIPFFLLDCFYINNRKKKLTLIGPRGLEKKVKKLMETLYPGTGEIFEKLKLEFLEYTKMPLKKSGMTIKAFPVTHSRASKPHAVNITIGKKTVGYSGDCSWNDNLILAAKGCDLFICECNFYDQKSEGHMDYKTLAENTDKLGCKKLRLTHLGEKMLETIENLELKSLDEGEVYKL